MSSSSTPKTPKQVPFSFRNPRSASNSSPTSSPSRSTSTSNLNPNSTTSPAPVPAEPLLPRHLESVYHRKLRNLLFDHNSAVENWQDVVSDHGARVAGALAKCWSDLESNYQNLQKLRTSNKSTTSSTSTSEPEKPPSFPSSEEKFKNRELSGGMTSPTVEAENKVYLSLKKVDETREESLQWRGKLQAALSKITSVSSATETLLLEAAKVKGMEFAFRDAMWGTWTLERFAASMASVTSQHVLCSSHLLLLLESISTSSPLNLSPTSSSSSTSSSIVSKPLTSDSNPPSSNPSLKRKKKQIETSPTSESYERASSTRSSALEEWLKLRFVDQFSTSVGSIGNEKGSHAWLIEICEVEVGRWKEGK